MTIREFNLLNISVLDNGKEVYSGKCEEAPEDLKNKQIKIEKIDDKTLIVNLVN